MYASRTILRDIDAINLAGILVVTYQGVNGGIGIAKGYRLDRSILTSDEMVSMITSLKGMARLIPESQHDVLLEKLKNVLNLSQLESVESKTKQLIIDPSPWFNVDKINEKLTVFKKAIPRHFGRTNISSTGVADSRGSNRFGAVIC